MHTITLFNLPLTDSSGHFRLRLQQKLHIRCDSKVIARISGRIRCSTDVETILSSEFPFGAHYVELVQLEPELSNNYQGTDMPQ